MPAKLRLATLLSWLFLSVCVAPGPAFGQSSSDHDTQAQLRQLLERAKEEASRIPQPTERRLALSSVAWLQAESGDVRAALATADLSSDEDERASLLADIASARAKAGDLIGAVETAHWIAETAPASRANALRWVAARQAEGGDIAGAATTLEQAATAASRIEDVSHRAEVLGEIARVHAEMGDNIGYERVVSQVRAMADGIEDANKRATALWGLATRQAQAGRIREALETAQAMQSAWLQDGVMLEVAMQQIRTGDLEAALHTAGQLQESQRRVFALQLIAGAQAEKGQLEEALNTTKAIGDASQEARALADIALAVSQQGNRGVSSQLFLDALDKAAAADPEYRKYEALSYIARAQALAGEIPAALATMSRIQDDTQRPYALAAVLEEAAKRGDLSGLQLAELEESPVVRTYILIGIANGIWRAERK